MIGEFINNVRRNHALEHATVSLLLGRLGPSLRLVGRATGDGFFIYGNVPHDLLAECAEEGLQRLKRGEAFWAVTPLCGTNIATAGVLATIGILAATNGQKERFGRGITAGVLAVTLAQPIGRSACFTTSPDLEGTEIVGVIHGLHVPAVGVEALGHVDQLGGRARVQAVGELEVEKVLHQVMDEALGERPIVPAVICLGIAGVDRARSGRRCMRLTRVDHELASSRK